ncbi:MAG: amidase [Pseudomonadota bacterium]
MGEAAILEAGVHGLAAVFESGAETPLTVFEAYAARIKAHNPKLHAFLDLRLEAAREEAAASAARWAGGAPLSSIDGAPIGIKANIGVAGLPRHAGIGAYRDEIATADAPVVANLKSAGAVVLGILNMHEGALGATTDNEAFGRTQNPWREGFTPGGSSGGSGAAVAAGLCAAALGSDTMGSVRIPSAYCGCVGHKPATGLVSIEGVLALSPTLDHVGPHGRQAADLPPLLEAMSGAAIPAGPADLPGLRIGVWTGAGEIELEPAVASGFDAACEKLSKTGASLTPAEPPDYRYGRDRRAGLLISEVEAAEIHAERLAVDPEGFTPLFRKLMAWGAARPQAEKDAAYARVPALADAARALFETVDFVVAPTAPQTAFSFEQDAPANQADFTAWADFAGLPATAVYAGQSADGLPLSLQVIGPRGEDAATLAAAAAIEAVLGRAPLPPGFI